MIYLDYSATTKTDKRVMRCFNEVNEHYFANPNSNHKLGVLAQKVIDEATSNIKKTLGITEHDLIYTSSATEANNLAIKGSVSKLEGRHIVTTKFEHSSVIAAINYLVRDGYSVSFVSSSNEGVISFSDLEALIREDTALISISAVNSEIGIIQPVFEIGRLLKKKYPNIVYHVDLTQYLTKLPVDFSNIDLATFSAHKFYGIKGIACLVKRRNLLLEPQIHGGKSTTVYRAGTPATALIASLDEALVLAYEDREIKYERCLVLNKYLKNKLKQIQNIHINSNEHCLPHIVNFSIVGANSNEIQQKLSDVDVYISTKTACSNGSDVSQAVFSLTNDLDIAKSSLRVSLSHLTTEEEIDIFIEKLLQIVGGSGDEVN